MNNANLEKFLKKLEKSRKRYFHILNHSKKYRVRKKAKNEYVCIAFALQWYSLKDKEKAYE